MTFERDITLDNSEKTLADLKDSLHDKTLTCTFK